MWPGSPLRAHWGVEDLAAAPAAEAPAAFQTAHEILHRRARHFTDADLAQMDAAALQGHLHSSGLVP